MTASKCPNPKCGGTLGGPRINESCVVRIAINQSRRAQGNGKYGEPEPSADDVAKAMKLRRLPGLYEICIACGAKVVHCTCAACAPR